MKLAALWILTTVVVLALLAACGGSDDDRTSPPAEESPEVSAEPTPTPQRRTRTPAASPTQAVRLCDLNAPLVTPDEADEALGEFVTGIPTYGSSTCQYDTESGIYLRIEPGSQDDFRDSAELEGVAGEPVPGIGDEAAWFAATRGVLSVREGDVHFRIVLNLPDESKANQLEIARDLAAIAVERLP